VAQQELGAHAGHAAQAGGVRPGTGQREADLVHAQAEAQEGADLGRGGERIEEDGAIGLFLPGPAVAIVHMGDQGRGLDAEVGIDPSAHAQSEGALIFRVAPAAMAGDAALDLEPVEGLRTVCGHQGTGGQDKGEKDEMRAHDGS